MAYTAANLACIWAGSSASLFRYSTQDAMNTVFAYNYFGAASDELRVGDVMIIASAGGVSNSLSPVTGSASAIVTVTRYT